VCVCVCVCEREAVGLEGKQNGPSVVQC